MNRLPEFAVARPTIIITFVMLAVMGGIYNFLTMPRREDPEFTLKVCVITTRWAGASAEQVERHVTDGTRHRALHVSLGWHEGNAKRRKRKTTPLTYTVD